MGTAVKRHTLARQPAVSPFARDYASASAVVEASATNAVILGLDPRMTAERFNPRRTSVGSPPAVRNLAAHSHASTSAGAI